MKFDQEIKKKKYKLTSQQRQIKLFTTTTQQGYSQISGQIINQGDSAQVSGYLSTQKLCSRHQNKEYIDLSTDPACTDDLVFKCEFCVVEQTLQSKYLLPISQLATSDLKTVFWHWPLPDNSELLEKVRALSTREKPDAAYKQKIDKFFKEMRIEVMARIDEVQASMNKQAQTLWDFDHTIFEQYSQLSAKEALKSAVSDNSEGIEQLSMRIRRTVTGVLPNTEVVTSALKSSLAWLELQESAVDFTGPQRIKEDILANMSRISMFLVENMQDLQMQQQEQPAHFGQMEAEAEGNLDVVLRLASCRFNDLSEGFRERMRSQLQKFRRIFDTVQLGETKEQECKRVAEFDSLEEEEVREVKAFAERLIEAKKYRERGENRNKMKVEDLVRLLSNKANHASEEMIAESRAMLEGVSRYVSTFEVDSIHKDEFEQEKFEGMGDSEISTTVKVITELKELFGEREQEKKALEEVINIGKQIVRAIAQPRQQNTRSLNSEKIMEMVKNDTNFCSQEYVHSLQTALKGVQLYLGSFELAERENQGLDREQLNNLGNLGSKIKDLSARYGANYKGRSSPNEEEQPKSVRISRWLVNHIGSNGQKELDSLLCKLPVFELTECEWVGVGPIQWKWMKTGYGQSSTLSLQNEGNGVRVAQTNNCRSQAVTESPLENNLVYSVKCTFNRPLNGVLWVIVGLISEDQINSCHIGQVDNHNSFWSNPSYGHTQIIKGQLLNSATLNTTVTTILFRFCIQTQTFLLSDPTLQNISIVDKTKINPNTKYRFGISFIDIGNAYTCLFSDVMTSFDQASVDKF